MALESLNDHNARVQREWAWSELGWSRPNGIACPECGEELLDTNPNEMLLAAPPQFKVHCPFCEYSGTRF